MGLSVPLIQQTVPGDLNDAETKTATRYTLNPLVWILRLKGTIDEKAEKSHMDTVIPLETEAMVFHFTIHLIL